MAFANVACVLAKSIDGHVLMIDWDLEAPGLHRFFGKRIIDGSIQMDNSTLDKKPGLIDLFIDLKRSLDEFKTISEENIIKSIEEFNFNRFILRTDIPSLSLIKAGKFDDMYSTRVNSFNWEKFYAEFPDVFKNLALFLSKKYKYILIDSRTGITDISGITTMLMPDKLVAVFTPNRQSLTGVLNLINEALDYRKQSNDLRPIVVFPLPSRIDASEPDLLKKWRHGDTEQDILGYQDEFEKLFMSIYDLPECSLNDYFNEVKIQHIPRYSYGEEIAVLVESSQDRLTLSESYENFAKKIITLGAPWIGSKDKINKIIPHQIPPSPRDFTGREKEISDILSGFKKGAAITGLRGMGGVGKTALALKLAERIKNNFPDGQIFIEMRGTSTNSNLPALKPEEAMAHVIRAYNPTDRLPENLTELRGLYLSVLAGKRALLLLDNASNVEQVEPLLPPAGCSVIITSRLKFTLPGLAEKDLDILPAEEARQLILAIAPRIGSRADELGKLCGYLPLALRNAASALAEKKDLKVSEYEKRLKDKFARLELVKSSFSLSYDLLSPMRRKQWSRLSVFPEDFDRNAATAVLKMAPGASAEALSDLVRWSLVDIIAAAGSEDGRYKLHDLSRLFAESFLQGVELADAKQRHANYYSKVLSKAGKLYEKGGKDLFEGLKLFDQELANFKVGHAWIKSSIRSYKMFNKSDQRSIMLLARSYANDGIEILDLRLHPREQIGWLETGIVAAKIMMDCQAEGVHLGNLGRAYAGLGDARKAIEYYEQALVIACEIGDRRGEAAHLGNLGNAYSDLGDLRKAIEFREHALKISREIGDRRGEGNALGNLGLAYSDLGDLRKAIEFYEQALKISREIGDRRGEGARLGNLGLACSDLGDLRKAIEFREQALKISREIGDRRGEAAHLGNLGNAYSDLGEPRKAIEFHEQALAIAGEIADKQNESEFLCNLGKAYLDLKEVDKTIDKCKKSLDLARSMEYRKFEGEALCTLGKAFTAQGGLQKALDYCDQALEIFKDIEYPKGEAEALFARSHALHQLDLQEEATQCAQEALAIFQRIESPLAEKVRQQLADWGSPPET
jgi:tetratricopeptide (TPR) repeat protein/MinD-like ATPase involved in chromosome partitioning or flagellar assembly